VTAPDAVPATVHLLRAAALFTLQLDRLVAQLPSLAPLVAVEVRIIGGEPSGRLHIDTGETAFADWCKQLGATTGQSIGQGIVVADGRLGGLPVHLLGGVSGRVYDELGAEWPVRRLRELGGAP
jgi:hypothetical protein